MLFILNVINSPTIDKRYRAIFNDGTFIDFGEKYAESYIDHKCKERRLGYWKIMYNDERNCELLFWLIPSDAVLTVYLLYGDSTDLFKNIEILNTELKKNSIL